jgi:hypothetical protein
VLLRKASKARRLHRPCPGRPTNKLSLYPCLHHTCCRLMALWETDRVHRTSRNKHTTFHTNASPTVRDRSVARRHPVGMAALRLEVGGMRTAALKISTVFHRAIGILKSL